MNRWASAFRLFGIGFFIVGCLIMGVLLGVWLDELVGVKPLFTFLGLAVGLAAASFGVYRMILPFLGEGRRGREKGE